MGMHINLIDYVMALVIVVIAFMCYKMYMCQDVDVEEHEELIDDYSRLHRYPISSGEKEKIERPKTKDIELHYEPYEFAMFKF